MLVLRQHKSNFKFSLRKVSVFVHVLATAVAVLACVSAVAQTAQPASQPLWEYGVTGFGINAPAYVGSQSKLTSATVLPWFIYRGDVFRADQGSLGARVLKTETVEFDVGFAAALGASSKDVIERVGMPSLGFQFEFGPRAKILLAQPDPTSRVRLELPLRAVFEARSGLNQRGWAFEPEISWAKRDRDSGLTLGLKGSVAFANQRYGQFIYGVPSAFATATRPAFEGKGGLVAYRMQATALKRLAPSWSGFAFVRYDDSGNGVNRASPLHTSNGGTSIGGGLVWTIGSSTAKGSD